MRYQSHLLVALSAITACRPWEAGIIPAVAVYGLGIVGGLLPDIDHPKSFIGSKVPLIPTILYNFSGHRGVTHSLAALGGVSIVGFMLAYAMGFQSNLLVCWALGIGYATHLMGDVITNGGIPLCWPISKRFVIPITKTGAFSEVMIVVPLFLLTVALAVPWTQVTANLRFGSAMVHGVY